jgi:uncharacterized membrane protein YraQ (UPF0718 family)
VLGAITDALASAGGMAWEVLWPLILGFLLSAVVESLARREQVARLLAGDGPRELAIATGLGAASSSCSYAAVALARSLFRKGASLTSAMAFEIASTNLVIELGLILALLLGWQFAAAEFVGGPIMIIVLAVLLRRLLTRDVVEEARAHAERGLAGRMEGHAAMDMSIRAEGSLLQRLRAPGATTSISHLYVANWASVFWDVVLGLLIAGAMSAWVPDDFWRAFFLSDDKVVSAVWGPIIGPLVAAAAFVCSIGNVPLAAVLWNGGISFGGVVSFIFADLLVLPVLRIKRRYYGTRATIRLAGAFYVSMVVAGYAVELIFGGLSLIPTERNAMVLHSSISWDYRTVLNIVFLAINAALVVQFLRTGGPAMLRMMSSAERPEPDAHAHH